MHRICTFRNSLIILWLQTLLIQVLYQMLITYKTISAFGDAQVFRDRLENGWLGLGGMILNDQAGSGSLASTKIYGSLAYHQMLGLSSLLSAGFNIGWANKHINQSKLKFPDQFDGKFFDSNIPSNVAFTNNYVSYMDVHAGLKIFISMLATLYNMLTGPKKLSLEIIQFMAVFLCGTQVL